MRKEGSGYRIAETLKELWHKQPDGGKYSETGKRSFGEAFGPSQTINTSLLTETQRRIYGYYLLLMNTDLL